MHRSCDLEALDTYVNLVISDMYLGMNKYGNDIITVKCI